MKDRALAANQPAVDREIVVTGDRRDIFAPGVAVGAPPLGVHGARFDPRNHPDRAPRRLRERRCERAPDGFAPLGEVGP